MQQNVYKNRLDILAGGGARQIFGVTGDALNAFFDAIRKDDRFEWIDVRHEENAAYMAYSHAELTGGIGVCTGTVGSGELTIPHHLHHRGNLGVRFLQIQRSDLRPEARTSKMARVA
ncbi:MAG: hypothetical protein MK106_06315 [Mariniblastus sp.]|nr:hypothetical protein [Mariniblastus sp.]